MNKRIVYDKLKDMKVEYSGQDLNGDYLYTITADIEIIDELEKLAAKNGMTLSKYTCHLLEEAMKENRDDETVVSSGKNLEIMARIPLPEGGIPLSEWENNDENKKIEEIAMSEDEVEIEDANTCLEYGGRIMTVIEALDYLKKQKDVNHHMSEFFAKTKDGYYIKIQSPAGFLSRNFDVRIDIEDFITHYMSYEGALIYLTNKIHIDESTIEISKS